MKVFILTNGVLVVKYQLIGCPYEIKYSYAKIKGSPSHIMLTSSSSNHSIQAHVDNFKFTKYV